MHLFYINILIFNFFMSSTCFESEVSPPGILPRSQYRTQSSTFKTSHTDALKHSMPYPQVQPSFWRWTLGFETCRRHQKIKN